MLVKSLKLLKKQIEPKAFKLLKNLDFVITSVRKLGVNIHEAR